MMQALLVALVLSAADPTPVPAADELARAQAEVEEVFGRDLTAARKPADRTAIAQKMIETAAGSGPAARYSLLRQARDLAISANDSPTAVWAVDLLVSGFAPDKQEPAAAWASNGHRLWNQGKDLKARVGAAECYLRALPGLDGFHERAIVLRLKELGWDPDRKDYLPPEKLRGLFGLPHEGWRVDGEALVGRVGNLDRLESHTKLSDPIQADSLEFVCKIEAKSHHVALLDVNGSTYWCSRGHWRNSGMMVARGQTPISFDKTGYGVDAGWHTLGVRFKDGLVTFCYDGQVSWSGRAAGSPPWKLRPGFASFDQEVRIKEAVIRSDGKTVR